MPAAALDEPGEPVLSGTAGVGVIAAAKLVAEAVSIMLDWTMAAAEEETGAISLALESTEAAADEEAEAFSLGIMDVGTSVVVTGQTVVYAAVVAVTTVTSVFDSAGQSLTVGAQVVIVYSWVV